MGPREPCRTCNIVPKTLRNEFEISQEILKGKLQRYAEAYKFTGFLYERGFKVRTISLSRADQTLYIPYTKEGFLGQKTFVLYRQDGTDLFYLEIEDKMELRP